MQTTIPARITLASVLIASCASAQGAMQFITPLGAEFFEGNGASDIMFGNWAPNTHYQQIENNLAGRIMPIRFLGWRRNNTSGGAAKTTTVTVIMSHSDFNTTTTT